MELIGTIQPPGMLTAPLSGAPCVLYRVRLSLLQRLMDGWGDGGSRELAGARFTIVCRLGSVLVDCTGAKIHLPPASRHRARLGQDPGDDHRLATLYQRLLRHPPARTGKTIAALEQRLEPGARVWASGDLANLPDALGQPAGYRQPPSRLLLHATELAALPVS